MIKIFKQIWFWIISKGEKYQFQYKFVEDIPDLIIADNIYIIGGKNYKWLIAFECPCGCGDTIQLNLLKDAEPCWEYRLKGDKITLNPSISRIVKCKSHFFVKNGNIEWR